jgi:hypothetical protein
MGQVDPEPFDRSDASIRPVKALALRVIEQACKDALAGRPVSTFGLEPWAALAGLKPERVDAVLARARRVVRGW